MKLAPVLLLGCIALLSGCVTYQKPVPEGYTGPTATVLDSGVTRSSSLVHIFEMTQIDGRKLPGSALATVNANQGRGFSQNAVVLSRDVPAQPARVKIAGTTQYAAPILAIMNPTCRVEGEVAFAPEAGKRYRVTGALGDAECAAWIEDAESLVAVTEKVRGKGLK